MNQWRQAGLRARRALSPQTRDAAAREIRRRLVQEVLPALIAPSARRPGSPKRYVAMFRPLPDEPDFLPFCEDLWQAGVEVAFPRMAQLGGQVTDAAAAPLDVIDMRLVPTGIGATRWETGPFGILEPPGSAPIVTPDELDLIFVPGAAFGEAGERIGMGAGYYDRYLCASPQARRIAVAFEAQIFARLPQEKWDQPMDWIATERRWLDCRAARAARNESETE